MNLTVTGQNFEITDAIKKFLNKRITKTGNRLFDNANIHFFYMLIKIAIWLRLRINKKA